MIRGFSAQNQGDFTCQGTDDKDHLVRASVDPDGALHLFDADGRRVTRLFKGGYVVVGEPEIHLRCGHPNAP